VNCIVTAGPAFEPLDEVRRLTNFSTGRLGTELANELTARGHSVTLLLSETATWPGPCQARARQRFSSARDLRDRLKTLAPGKVDAIFHAAAVSDFGFGRMFTRDAGGRLVRLKPARKIATRGGGLLVELVPTPKIIAELRGWFPRARLVGWKFEVEGRRAGALRAARRQIAECAMDACVANGPAYGKGYGLVTANGHKHLADKRKLFAALEKLPFAALCRGAATRGRLSRRPARL
jgi:phosphopantothenoylcysteine decarboxylase/phosphopantothenate--cysteine ligase